MLEVDRDAAPVLRVYVYQRLSEVPSVAVEVLSDVLALTIDVIYRLGQDSGTSLPPRHYTELFKP